MFKFLKAHEKDTEFKLKLIFKLILVVLLAIIAFHSSSLSEILKEIKSINKEKQLVVNVNNTMPSASSPQMVIAPMAGEEKKAPPAKQANAEATQTNTPSPETAPSKNVPASPVEKQASDPEPNPNPTTHIVKMLNNSPEGAMVFSPPYIHIKTGDSIEFEPASYGHNVQTPEDVIGSSDAIPKNAKAFKGAMNEKLIVKFTEPGIYLYICNYHYIVGHVGVIQVGNDSHNLKTVQAAAEILKGKIFSHPDRVDKYLSMVKKY